MSNNKLEETLDYFEIFLDGIESHSKYVLLTVKDEVKLSKEFVVCFHYEGKDYVEIANEIINMKNTIDIGQINLTDAALVIRVS